MTKLFRVPAFLCTIIAAVFSFQIAYGLTDSDACNLQQAKLKPSISELKTLIDSDPVVWMYFTQMIDQVPGYYKQTPNIELTSTDQMLFLINNAMTGHHYMKKVI